MVSELDHGMHSGDHLCRWLGTFTASTNLGTLERLH
jgi:hypothetical protein